MNVSVFCCLKRRGSRDVMFKLMLLVPGGDPDYVEVWVNLHGGAAELPPSCLQPVRAFDVLRLETDSRRPGLVEGTACYSRPHVLQVSVPTTATSNIIPNTSNTTAATTTTKTTFSTDMRDRTSIFGQHARFESCCRGTS